MPTNRPGRVVIGVDAGTTAIKSVAFALDGSVRASARREVPNRRDAAGSSETDMERLWGLAVETLREIVEGIDGAEIVGIGVTGQGDGAWFVDAAGAPTGPAVLWNDARAAGIVEEWERSGEGEAVRRATGSSAHPGALPAVWEALRRSGGLPEAAARHLNCKDWIRYRLVGAAATDPTDASRTWLDVATGDYAREPARSLGQDELLRLLPEVRPSEALAGSLLPEVQRELGLGAPVPVSVGAFDAVASGIGLGAIGDRESYIVLGTTALVCTNQASAAERRHPDSILLRTGRGDQVAECLAQMSGMPNLDWARSTLGLDGLSWDEIERRVAERDRDRAAEALFLPYTSPSGERAPFHDVHASGGWVGLDISADPIALISAVYTGLACSVAESLLGLERDEEDADGGGAITVSGGGAQSRLLCGLLADLSGRTVIRQIDSEVGARGAAALALVSAGAAPGLAEAAAALQPETESFAPDPERREDALVAFETFRAVRDALRPQWSRLRALRHPIPSRR